MRGALSLLFWVFVGASSIVMFPVALLILVVTAPFDRSRRALHQFTCFWASMYSWLNPAWRVSIEGRDRIRRGVAYVMVANHQSLVDILVLFRLFVHFKWVSKQEVFRVPFIGWNMFLNGYVRLRRGDSGSIARMLRACERWIARGSSVMLFPEGTRSTGVIGRFKHGAFTLARKTGAPILPIVIEGSGEALPRKGFVLRGLHRIRIRVLDEIPADTWPEETAEGMALRVRDIFAQELGCAPVPATGS